MKACVQITNLRIVFLFSPRNNIQYKKVIKDIFTLCLLLTKLSKDKKALMLRTDTYSLKEKQSYFLIKIISNFLFYKEMYQMNKSKRNLEC